MSHFVNCMFLTLSKMYARFITFKKIYTLKNCSLQKIDNNSSWVNCTHFREKTHLLALELIFFSWSKQVYMHSSSNKKRNTPIYFNTNYRTEMKLVPIIMDYCLLQFDSLKFFLGVRQGRTVLVNLGYHSNTSISQQ